MAISYTRTFTHREWIDNVDRVQAGGDNGFNGRFHTIEAEFDTIGGVFRQVSSALDALSAAAPAQEARITLTPALIATADNAPWSHDIGFAQKPSGSSIAQGMMSVSLPQGAKITQLRAAGQNSGAGKLTIALKRQSVKDASAAADDIAAIKPEATPPSPGSPPTFDKGQAASPQFERVDNGQFKYFVYAEVHGATGANDVVTLISFQVVYMTS